MVPKNGSTMNDKKIFVGGVDAGGGNLDVAEFYLIARAVAANYLSYSSTTDLDGKGQQFAPLVRKLTVEESKEDLFNKGQLVDAINYPTDNKIVFNSKSWTQRTLLKKVELVVHELLGLLKIPDPSYLLSWNLVLELQSYQPIIFQGGLEKFLELSRVFKLSKVTCKAYRGYAHEPTKIFDLETENAGLGARVNLSKTVYVEVHFGYAPKPQIVIDLATRWKPTDPEEAIGGKRLASLTVNVIGDAVDANLQTPQWQIDCSVPDSN